MATTSTLYATGATQVAGTWTNPASATGAPNATGTTAPTNCATWVNATRSATATLELSGYNFQAQVPSNAVGLSVAATIPHAETSTANITGLTAQLYSGATAIGAAVTVTRVTSLTTHTVTFPTAPTWAQLADLRVRLVSTRANNTTSSTEYIDAAGLQVTYTPIAKIGTLTDDFTAADTVKWTYGAAATVSGGQLLLTPNTAYTGFISSSAAYDLSGSAAVVELPQAANGGNGTVETYVVVYVDNANSNSALFDVIGGQLRFLYRISGVTAGTSAGPSIAYDPAAHRWLRISESGGSILWDTSPDRSTWTNRASWAPSWAITALYVSLGNGYGGTEPNPGVSLFDNFNASPGEVHTTAGTATAKAAASATGASARPKTGTATGRAAATATDSGGHVTAAGAPAKAAAVATTAGVRTTSGAATAKAAAGAVSGKLRATSATATARATATAATTSARTLTGAATAKAAAAAVTGHVEGDHVTTGTAQAKAAATAATGTVRVVSATAAAKGIASATSATARTGTATATARSTASALVRTQRGGQAYATATAAADVDTATQRLTLGDAPAYATATAVSGQGSAWRDITVTWGQARGRTLAGTAHTRTLEADATTRELAATAARARTVGGTARTRTLTGRLED